MPLKILVIHSTSLVGKSTTVASLLHPRLKQPRVFSVEKQNQDASRYGIEVVRYRSGDLKKLIDDIIIERRNLIVDVGASQYSDVMKEYSRVRGAINDFDVAIVPTTPDGRVQEETLGTIELLLKAGLQPEKLRVLFNRATIDADEDLDVQFEPVIAFLTQTSGLAYYSDLVVYENQIHADLRAEGLSFDQVANDKTDHKKVVDEALRKSPDSPDTMAKIRRLGIQRAVVSAKMELDTAFAALRLPKIQVESNPTVQPAEEK
ncbi:hypothetical protein E2P84_22595 [Burkholderia cepacia]|uniref:Plasmid stability protein StbB n=1 Tax=Burkholderia cepacia TaxID=292 RepID=A0AAX2RIX5_BURCE|nr:MULTISPECIES: hypothetical protein [Burkholderia cepacia complex]TES73149.1 hypothetical protein E2P84_22595 [Burkholderia cepacia]TES99163.1 hypothetical protein E3D36_26050 [Burkholderia cepacia]TEU40094.1 hypothetical protein E3D37_29545 [Burkholderia cepacia]TEU46932.1 hypothetical protein E3D38_24550 [Burkholderia cepacia]TEU93549.1 hypothetical protein E3D40_28115 [Burkholderia cepacia]